MAITVNESEFLGVGLEMMAYGIYVVVFVLAFSCLTWDRKTHSIHKFYLFFCCFLYCLCSIHVFIKFRYLYKDLGEPADPTGVLEVGTTALRVADALVTLIDFFAQLVLIYRCWIIWDRNHYVIIAPVIISLASVSCAMAEITLISETRDAAFAPQALVPLGTAAFAIPLGFNFLVTGLIAGRIWHQTKERRKSLRLSGAVAMPHAWNYVKDSIGVVIESAVVYLLAQFALTVLFAMNHPAQILVSDIAVQVYGIAPTMIFVRVSMKSANHNRDESSSSNRETRPGAIMITREVGRVSDSGGYHLASFGRGSHEVLKEIKSQLSSASMT